MRCFFMPIYEFISKNYRKNRRNVLSTTMKKSYYQFEQMLGALRSVYPVSCSILTDAAFFSLLSLQLIQTR